MKFHDILLVVNKKVMLVKENIVVVKENIVLMKENYGSNYVFRSRVEEKFDLVSKTFCAV